MKTHQRKPFWGGPPQNFGPLPGNCLNAGRVAGQGGVVSVVGGCRAITFEGAGCASLRGACSRLAPSTRGGVVHSSPMNELDITRLAYKAYGDTVEWMNFRGDPMPTFDELPPRIREAWVASTCAAIEAHELGRETKAESPPPASPVQPDPEPPPDRLSLLAAANRAPVDLGGVVRVPHPVAAVGPSEHLLVQGGVEDETDVIVDRELLCKRP